MADPGEQPVITYRRHGAIAVVSMDDGKVNALTLRMLAALNGALDQALKEEAPVVLTGREGRFSAGFDLKTLTGGGEDGPKLLTAGFELSERLLSFPFPVVIACTGHALAMGAFLLLSGDHRIGAEGAFKIGANEVAIGLTMPHTAIEICRQRVSPTHFSRVMINAEIFGPSEAVGAGFLDRVVPATDLAESALEAAEALSKLDMRAHAATKLRARGPALSAIHASIAVDEAAFRQMLGERAPS
jgi:enoyl-CoA hydratase